MHLFVTGEVGVGKTTLINYLLAQITDEKIYGFYTRKIAVDMDSSLSEEIYIYPADQEEQNKPMCCVASILGKGKFDLHVEAFEAYGVSLLSDIPDGSIVVMDELGFLESQAPAFCQKVLDVLNRNVITIGVIKAKHTAFLDQVRDHPSVRVYTITKENRTALTQTLAELFKEERNARNVTGKSV